MAEPSLAFGHQEDRNLVVARAQEPDQGAGPFVLLVVLAEIPVDQHGMDGGVRSDDRLAVLGGSCFDNFDRSASASPGSARRIARPSAVALPSSSSTTSTRIADLAGLALDHLGNSSAERARAASFAGRVPFEDTCESFIECNRTSACTARRTRTGCVELAERTIDEEPEVLSRRVPARVPPDSFVNRRSRMTRSLRCLSPMGTENQRALAKEDIGLPVDAPAAIPTGSRRNRHDPGVHLQCRAPALQPGLRCRPGDDGERSFLSGPWPRVDRARRGLWARDVTQAPRRNAAGASARSTARLPPAKMGIENETSCLLASVALVGAHSRSTLPCCTSLRRLSGVTRHPLDRSGSAARVLS